MAYFNKSFIYQRKIGESFGWGLWNDPIKPIKEDKHGNDADGKTNDVEEAKKGYARFLEMAKNSDTPFGTTYSKKLKKIVEKKRYNKFTGSYAKVFAEKRLKEL